MQGVIHRIKAMNGTWVDTNDDIANEVIWYFSDLLSEPVGTFSELLHLIPSIITRKENRRLEASPSMEEVKRVVFEMDSESAAGPDGFTGKFFHCS